MRIPKRIAARVKGAWEPTAIPKIYSTPAALSVRAKASPPVIFAIVEPPLPLVEQYCTVTYWAPTRNLLLPRLGLVYYLPHWQVVQAQVIEQKASDHFPGLAILLPTVKERAPLPPHCGTEALAGSAPRRF